MSEDLQLCPQCGSARVDYGMLAGANAKCHGCGWTGPDSELLTLPSQQDSISGADKSVQLVNDLRKIMAGDFGVALLHLLVKWGFLNVDTQDVAGTLDRKLFARYIVAMARGITQAILSERARQEDERVRKAAQEYKEAN